MDPYGGKRLMWGPQPDESHHYAPIYQSIPGYVSAYYEGAYAQAYNAPLDQYPMDSQAYHICRYTRQIGIYRQHPGLHVIALKHTEVSIHFAHSLMRYRG